MKMIAESLHAYDLSHNTCTTDDKRQTNRQTDDTWCQRRSTS